MSIWLTRPEPDSRALAEALAHHGIGSIIAPVIRIEPKPVTLGEKPDALLVTSRHAAHALPEAWRDLPVFCVGVATADSVRQQGYTTLVEGSSDGLALLSPITAALRPGQRLLYLSGDEVRHDFAALLAAHGIAVERMVAYETVPCQSFPPALRLALANGEISGVAFFSPHSARLGCGLLKEEEFTDMPPRIDAFCLSLAVAQEAAELPWRSLQVSHSPTREAMVAMIAAARAVAS